MLRGRCHCGDTVFEIDSELPQALTRCTCTFCSKRGHLYAYYEPNQFRLVSAPKRDVIYRWNTGLVAHHFCDGCGCGLYSDSPDFQMDGSWDCVTRRIGSMRGCWTTLTRRRPRSQSSTAGICGSHLPVGFFIYFPRVRFFSC